MSRRLLPILLALAPVPAWTQQFPPSPPPPGPVTPARFPPFQETLLANGVRLILVENHRHPVLSLSLSLPAGRMYDPPGKEGLSSMAAGLLSKGAGERSAEDFAATVEGQGGSLSAQAGPDYLAIQVDVLSTSAPLAFELLADAALRPTFDLAELELLRKQTLTGLQEEMAEPASIAARFFAKSLYGDHPYGLRPTPASIGRISRDDLVTFKAARFRPAGALLVIAGDLSLEDAKRLATASFGSWTGRPAIVPPPKAPPVRSKAEILLVHRPGSVQSNILVGNTAFGPNDPNHYAATVADRVLGGAADSRLFLILREQKSWTYGAFSQLTHPKGPGAFSASVEVRTEVTDSALRELLVQLKRIRTELVPAAELSAAKSALVGSFPLTIQTANQIAGAVAEARLLGLPPDYLQSYRTRLAAVTPIQLRASARTAIRPDVGLIVVVGDGTKIYDGLKAIAPVRIVTPEGQPLSPDALAVRPQGLELDLDRLTPRRDTLTVLLQGKPFGSQVAVLEKRADGYHYQEDTRIGTVVQQTTEITLDSTAGVIRVSQRGTMQGQDTRVGIEYDAGRVKGAAQVAGPQGPKQFTIDTAVPPGVLDDNSIQILLPALRWTASARWTLPVFSSGENRLREMTLAVTGTDSVTVPAGTFEVYRAELRSDNQAVAFFVTTAVPHKLVKIAVANTPLEFVAEH